MRILHILEATRGGTRRHILDLLPALQGRGLHNELAFSLLRNPDFQDDFGALHSSGVATIEVPMRRGWGGPDDALALRLLARQVRGTRYDIIHCHSSKAGFLGRLVQPLASRHSRVVYTPHCIAFDTRLQPAQRRASRLIEALLAPLTNRYIAVSRHERRVLLATRLAGPERVSLVYNGMDLADFDRLYSEGIARASAQSADVMIGCFGRLTAQKNQAAVIRSLALVRRSLLEARLLLVGGGEDEPALRRLAEQVGVDRAIHWCGEVAEARPLYAQCRLVLQPSRWEGCPYTILEAMSARLGVVASAVGGMPEMICPGTGVVSQTTHPSKLAQHVLGLLRDEDELGRVGQRARQCVEDNFSLERMVRQTIEAYQLALNSPLRRPAP